MGGLGTVLAQYLAGAGIGCLGLVDDDVVSLSNLHRQLIYREQDISQPKVAVAAAYLRQLNPHITITPHRYAPLLIRLMAWCATMIWWLMAVIILPRAYWLMMRVFASAKFWCQARLAI